MKRFIFPSSIALTIIFFGFIFYQLFFVAHDPFPKLPPGKYIGFFPGDLIGRGDEKIFFSVESPEISSTLEIIIYSPGWGAKSIEVNGGTLSGSEAAPLIIIGPEAVLRFGGRIVASDRILGKVTNVASGKEADWSLNANPLKKNSPSYDIQQKQLLEVVAEESNLEIQIQLQKDILEKTAVDRVRLTKALSEGRVLEQKAENRFSEKQSEIDKLKEEIAKNESELSAMQSSLAVARSITQRGRLTTMARESLVREFREVDYKLSGQARHNDAALLAELARAKEALSLQEELSRYQGASQVNIAKEGTSR